MDADGTSSCTTPSLLGNPQAHLAAARHLNCPNDNQVLASLHVTTMFRASKCAGLMSSHLALQERRRDLGRKRVAAQDLTLAIRLSGEAPRPSGVCVQVEHEKNPYMAELVKAVERVSADGWPLQTQLCARCWCKVPLPWRACDAIERTRCSRVKSVLTCELINMLIRKTCIP